MNIMNNSNNVYDEQADTIKVEDITTNEKNRTIIRLLSTTPSEHGWTLFIQNEHHPNDEEDYTDFNHYSPEGSHDMGWLGYFIGKSERMEGGVSIGPFSLSNNIDVVEPLFRGINRKSIEDISLRGMNLFGGQVFTMLTSFFKDNHKLTHFSIDDCNFGEDGCRLFALAIGSCTERSLECIRMTNSNIAEEDIVTIITALSLHPQLQELDLHGNVLRENGCVAMSTLLRCSVSQLEMLNISNTGLVDEEIEVLVSALTKWNSLKALYIGHNPLVTVRGWESLATILEDPNSNLKTLSVTNSNIDDQTAIKLARVLAKNNMLEALNMGDNPSITASHGWSALSNILCDISSVNATFLSNHTLCLMDACIETNLGTAWFVDIDMLRCNRSRDKRRVATIKILKHHEDFDMKPFFEWEFKVLPLVISWLERASSYDMRYARLDLPDTNIEGRKLSSIYQFVRDMPVLYVETRLMIELEDIKLEESQMEEGEKERSSQFQTRQRQLQDRKKSIIEKLGVGKQA